MLIRIGLEHGVKGQSLAWALDYPGSFAYGDEDSEVLIRFAYNLLKYEAWVNIHTDKPWFSLSDLDFRTVEVWDSNDPRTDKSGGATRAWFQDDAQLVTAQQVLQAEKIHTWQREELLAGLETLPAEVLEICSSEDAMPIRDKIVRFAKTEYQYLGNLNLLLPQFLVSNDPFEVLEFSNSLVHSYLPEMIGCNNFLEKTGEIWTYRKFIRRLIWLQREFIDEIKAVVFRDEN